MMKTGAIHPRLWVTLCMAAGLPWAPAWAVPASGAAAPASTASMPAAPASAPVGAMPPVRSGAAAVSGVTGPGFNLVELLQELKSNSPQLIQARHNYLSAKSVPPQLAAPNNPQLGFIWSNIPKGFPAAVNRATGNAYSVTQQIPFPGKKSLAAEIADRQAESLNAQSDALYLQLYAQLSTTYYQAIALQKQIDVLKLTIARLEQVKQITRVRYANNAAAYADYLNAQVSQSSAQNDLFAAQRQYDTTVQTLNTLIGKEPSFPLELRAEDDAVRLPDEPLPELENQALRQHPSIKASTELLDAARKSVTLARKGYLPDFQVIATVNSDNPPYGVRPGSYQIELDIIIPFWFFTKEKSAVNQAVESQIATEANDVAVRQQTLLAVDTAYSTLRQTLAQLDFNKRRQLPQALAAYRVTMTHYASNNADFNDLLTAQGALKNAELAVAQAQATALQAYHALLAATGRSPVQAQ
ncbi:MULTISPECIES: TolC family protein [Ralstonia solanacearum species complex]|uniref:TolC family protein n=1 Tax=Ralstonia solanacearum species complex TaxID=3116862 RepID=UPI000E58D9FB|nr:TolC family protein [Ralstonia solanacearum]AXV79444.1 transporter [Ralstonia solanacearum]AXV93466.1 transporter [Ralstonia solanacearum]AXW21485.1 transporter [Ralstonia solanacearum]AXW78357.1 transporter [Ralstonia solanacearum]